MIVKSVTISIRKHGIVLPSISSNREIGATISCSMVPISRSLTMTEEVRIMARASSKRTTTPGTKKSFELRLGLNQARDASANSGITSLGVVESYIRPCMLLIREARMSFEKRSNMD